MAIIDVASTLDYSVSTPTTFVFSIVPALTPYQIILQEKLLLSPQLDFEWLQMGEGSIRHIRLQAQPGSFCLEYKAKVELTPVIDHAPLLDEVNYQVLPAEVMTYLNPSRYCESDRLAVFAIKQFGTLPSGHTRLEAICEWVNSNIDYISGSTNVSSSACDVLVNRAGVCRDFAHVCIALCRALCIPARYVSGYAVNLQPPDFHGFFEAFLGGKWYLFDATRMAPVSGFVRIGFGRDAADASFATIMGSADLQNMQISACDLAAPSAPEKTNEAFSTA